MGSESQSTCMQIKKNASAILCSKPKVYIQTYTCKL